ncbi:hypothetical protein V6N12_010951 [Hibiscus sabdariffa]|uniref:Zinc knuckle CX2CX4HX4C domain-containing protein n=1 Tax=Hibiscus sabdariffa TaxID=183260 RepID=A0ABR2ELL1_9ROSI
MVDLRDSVTGHSRDCVPDAMDVRDFPPLVTATNEGGASDGSGGVNPLGVDAACDFAKICVEVDVSFVLPFAIDVELGNGLCVEVGVELDWAPLCCSHCSIFGHLTDKCKKLVQSTISDPKLVSEDVLVGHYGDFATGGGGGFVAGAVDCVHAVGHVAVIEGDVDGVRASVVGDEPEMVFAAGDEDPVSATNASLVASVSLLVPVLGAAVGSSSDGSSSSIMEKVVGVPSNKFGVLCSIVEDQVVQYEHSRPERAAAGGVADLMEQLKPKDKGGKKKGKGRGTNVKGPIDGASTPL